MTQDYFASVTAEQLQAVMSEKLFSSVLHVMQCGVQVLRAIRDSDNRIVDFDVVYSNKAASLFKGGKNKNASSGYTGDKDDFFKKIVAAMEKGTQESHIEINNPDKTAENIIYTITKLVDGALVTNEKCDQQSESPISTLLEISDMNRANEIMQLALKSAGAGLGYFDHSTGNTIWNERGKEIMNLPDALSYTSEELLQKIYADDRDKVAAYITECAAEAKEFLMEFRVPHTEGLKHILGTAIFRKSAGGQLSESYGLVIDITHAKQAEEKISGLNKTLSLKNHELESANSEIKTFNSIASNDYRETLQKLYTNLEFILTKDAKNLSDSGKANLRKMQASIQKLKLLTEDIISFSNIHTKDERPVEVNLNRVFQRALEDLDNKIKESNAEIKSDLLPEIKGFPLLLSILFDHLLDNAIKFRNNDNRPIIKVSYTLEQYPGKKNEDSAAGNYHCISFTDNGVGFDNTEADRLFTMFYRLHEKNKFKGSGIGLAISKKIMDLHEGFITAERKDDHTEFRCYFPV